MQHFIKRGERQFIDKKSPWAQDRFPQKRGPNPLPTIEILDAAQRLNNPDTLKPAVFETSLHSETENRLAASSPSC